MADCDDDDDDVDDDDDDENDDNENDEDNDDDDDEEDDFSRPPLFRHIVAVSETRGRCPVNHETTADHVED